MLIISMNVCSGIFIERGAVPSVVGVNVNPYLNLGEMENKGVDASLEYYKTTIKVGIFQ